MYSFLGNLICQLESHHYTAFNLLMRQRGHFFSLTKPLKKAFCSLNCHNIFSVIFLIDHESLTATNPTIPLDEISNMQV